MDKLRAYYNIPVVRKVVIGKYRLLCIDEGFDIV